MAGVFGQERCVVIQRRNLITDVCCDDESCPRTQQRNRIRSRGLSPSELASEIRLVQSSEYETKTVKELTFGPMTRSKVTIKICRARVLENGLRTDRVQSIIASRVSDEEAKRFVVKLFE